MAIRTYETCNIQELKDEFANRIYRKTVTVMDSDSGKITSVREERLGELILNSTPCAVDMAEAAKAVVTEALRRKIAIPDAILNKPGRLNDEEYAIMKSHPQRGYDILKDVKIDPSLSIGAGYHHERLDGRGYPRGLKGSEIPEIARIIAVADTFDAMYSTRPYRKRLPLETVAAEIQRSAGTQLSPDVVKVFMELVEEGAFDNE
jgi:hypothetical protein